MKSEIADIPAYPLQFDPIFQYRLWGGRRLSNWIAGPFPDTYPVGEAWLLSDRSDNPSRVSNGPLKGRSLSDLMAHAPTMILGEAARHFTRFPLLLKYLDVAEMLSVQVHPSDDDCDMIPAGEAGKTEAWVVLEAVPDSRVYAGLEPGVTKAELRGLSLASVDRLIPSFTPHPGQCILIESGTIHSLGKGVVVLEVQQNSDVTFRLYDWDHIDTRTARRRPLQIEQALQCITIGQGAIVPATPSIESTAPVRRERLLDGRYFRILRLTASVPFDVGENNAPAVLICIEGGGSIKHRGADVAMTKGNLVLLPAALAACRFEPTGLVVLIKITLPEATS